jgi:hypothetical protein
VSEDQYAVRGKIEVSIPLMLRGVSEKDTPTEAGGGGGELMGSGGREVRIVDTPKDSKVSVRGSGAEEGNMGRGG